MAETNRDQNERYRSGMTCPLVSGEENADLLLDYCNRRLAPELTEAYDRHLAVCPACQAFAKSQSAVWNALDAFEAMPISEDFDKRLYARIEQEQRAGFLERLWNRLTVDGLPSWRPALPVAAALVVAVGLWVRPGTVPSMNEVAPVVKVESADAEQIERALEDMEMLNQIGVAETAPQQM